MLYMISLSHSPQQCPGVAVEIRDRALIMASTMTGVLDSHGCRYVGGWVGKTSHRTFLALDAPDAHAVDSALVDLGLAVWNTADIFPVIALEDAFGGLPE